MPQAALTDGLVHHWAQGPGAVHRVPGRRWSWKFYWFLDSVQAAPGQPPLKRKNVLQLMYFVLNHPQSWERSGVQFVRTMVKAKADILVRFGPQDLSACGPGSSGCYWWDSGEQKAIAYMGSEWVNQQEAMIYLIGMEMVGHGALNMLDHYNPIHQPYTGSMGSWEEAAKNGYWPTDTEIECAKAWLRGEAVHIHDD